jgi:tetratricopeptide (TPR) repeat protein
VAISAEEALRHLDPHTALELFELADPADVSARCGRIRALWALRRAAEARAALDALPPEVRGSAAGKVAEGTIALGLRDSLLELGIFGGSVWRDGRAALDAFAAAIALDPEDPIARRGLVTAYRLAEQAAEARATVDGAIADFGPLPGLLVESAWCHLDLCHTEAALKVLESAPEDIEALFATAAILEYGPWPPDAMPVYDHVRRLVPETSAALHGQLAGYLANMVWWTVGDAERAEFREHARQALLLLPNDPAVLLQLSFVSYVETLSVFSSLSADADVEAELYDDSGLPESPAIVLARCYAALRENHLTEALAHARRARVLDPHLLGAAELEVNLLSVLGRNREALIIAEAMLERCPDHGGIRYQLAMSEANQGHLERALELFPDDINPRNVTGKIAVLRLLGDFAAAESLASHPPRWPTGYWERRMREELAQNSIAQRHWKQGVTRLDAVLELDPANSEIRESRRAAARRARLGLSRRPPSEDTDAAIADTQNLTSMLDDLLPPGSPPSLRARLHQIHRRQWAIREDDRLENIAVGIWALAVLMMLVLSDWAPRALGASESTLLAIALPVTELVVSAVMIAWIANDGPLLAIFASVTLTGYGGAAAVLLSGHGHPGTLLLFLSLAPAFAATALWLLFAAMLVSEQVTEARSRRERIHDRFGHLVHDMLDLLVVLEYEPALIRPEVRRDCLAILERIARGQEQVLMAAVKSGGGVIEEPTGHAFRQHVAAVVAATRDLKRDVLSPGPRTWVGLRARLRDDLAATCHGHWDLLPFRTPDPVGTVLRIRLLSALRSLLVLLIPPGLLYLVSATRLLPVVPSQPVLLIGYLGWPALVILLWLDPELATKVNLVKAAGDAVNAFKQDKSAK